MRGLGWQRAFRGQNARERRSGTASLAWDVGLLGLTWGSSVVCQRLAVLEMEPLPMISWRLLTACLFFLPFAARVARSLVGRPRLLFDLAVIGALNPALTALLTALALRYASSGVVAVLISLGPLFSALLAGMLRDEPRVRAGQACGLSAALGGVTLLMATRSSGLAGEPTGDVRGQILALLIAAVMALATVYSRRRLAGVDPLASAAGQIGFGLLAVLGTSLAVGEAPKATPPTPAAWAAVLLSGAVGLGASFVLFLGMIERHGPTASLMALYVMPVAAAGLGALLLGERLTPSTLGGAALVVLGVWLFTRRPGPRARASGPA